MSFQPTGETVEVKQAARTARDRADSSLAEIVRQYEAGDLETAQQSLDKLLRDTSSNKKPRVHDWCNAFKGFIFLEQSDLKGGLLFLQKVRPDLAGDSSDRWAVPSITLARVGTARQSMERTSARLQDAQANLLEEIMRQETEFEELAKQLGFELRKASVFGDALNERDQDSAQLKEFSRSVKRVYARLLGDFHVVGADGRPVVLCSNRKGQALFKLLVTRPHRQFHKESLQTLFWKDASPDIASAKLHVAVSRLRRSLADAGLGKDCVPLAHDCYALSEQLDVRSDLAEFENHLEAGRRFESASNFEEARIEYERAATLYRGPYLAEMSSDDWLLPRRIELEEKYLSILLWLGNWYFTQEEYSRCERYCRNILRHDDLREDVVRLLMRCLGRRGQRNQAIRLYHELKNLLDDELGVSPMADTRQLFEMILIEENV